jgi:hypothetical protein
MLILGDYHTPYDEQASNLRDISKMLETITKHTEVDVYIEDVLYIGATTELKIQYEKQKSVACDADTCKRMTWNDFDMERECTLKNVNRFLTTCSRDDRICPLQLGNVYRVDIRAQTLLQKENNDIIQVVDDRSIKIDIHGFTQYMRYFVYHDNSQFVSLTTGIDHKVVKSLLEMLLSLKRKCERQHDMLCAWWLMRIQDSYNPLVLNKRFMFSEDYYGVWQQHRNDEDSQQRVLNTIVGNAIMDLSCIAQLLINDAIEGKTSLVYVGCAHAEIIAAFFSHHYVPCEPAIENEFRLNPVKKHVHFPMRKVHNKFYF